MLKRGLKNLLLLALIMLAFPARAEEPDDVFRVLSTRLNSEAERAEICLMLSQPIDVAARSALASAVSMEKDGARMQVSSRDLSVTPTDLCVQQLEHRHRYRLRIKKLRSFEGELLDEPVNLAFTVPDRKPSLSVVVSAGPGLPRYEQTGAPVIRALNVKTAKLTLYHLADRKTFAAALQQAAQLSLAPSESAYFASQKGKVVWQSDLVFGDKPNVEQNLDAPLPSGKDLPPGLYFLAVAPQAKSEMAPVLPAGQWFLVSDVRLSAMSSSKGFHVFVTDAKASQPVQDISLHLLAQDGTVLAEAKSGKDGAALLTSPQDKAVKPAFITALSAKGDVDLMDMARQVVAAYAPVRRDALLTLDRPHYRAGSTATVVLAIRDAQGRFQPIKDSALKMLRPDYSFVGEVPVSSEKAGVVFKTLSLPVTASAGTWHLLWQKTDGTVLAECSLRLTPDGVWPRIDVTADRDQLEADGKVTLSLKVTSDANKPLAWRGGAIEARLSRPEFASWKNVQFGVDAADAAQPLATTKFITADDGLAQARLELPLPNDASGARAVTLTIRLDQGAEPVTLTLPVKGASGWVGIRALHPARVFPENSLAAFAIMALDANAKRHAARDLYYHVYEEGRSFSWYQAEGHWDYKPLPQHRRIGGGRLAVPASGETVLRWPVTAGHYALEITDDDGAVLAQYGFQAGWNLSPAVAQASHGLRLYLPASPLEPEKENTLKLKLAQPAMVSVVMGDDQVRQTIHRFMDAGEQSLTLTPVKGWGNNGQIVVHAVFADGQEGTVSHPISFRHVDQELTLTVSTPAAVVAETALSLPIVVQKSAKVQATVIGALATPVDTGESLDPSSVTLSSMPLDQQGRAAWRFIPAVQRGALRVRLLAWNDNQFGAKTVTLPVQPVIDIKGEPPALLAVGDHASFALSVENRKGPKGDYAYTVTPPEGVRLKGVTHGKLSLTTGQSRPLSYDLIAGQPGQGNIELDIKGPNNFHERKIWPLTVRDDSSFFWAMTPQQLETGKSVTFSPNVGTVGSFVVAAPVPLPDLPHAWQSLLRAETFATEDNARWLEATRLWQSGMVASGLVSQEALTTIRLGRLRQLEASQNADGSFSLWPSGGTGDLSSTASVLLALRDESPQVAGLAARWLQQRLENTWFDESERSARARAFLALSTIGRVDLSALRYFADTSRDKELSPDAIAAIALALALSHDDEAARTWLGRAREVLSQKIDLKQPEAWLIMQRFADNGLVEPKDMRGDLERVALLAPETQEQVTASLQTMSSIMRRMGDWDIVINEQYKKLQGVYVGALNEKAGALAVKNPSQIKAYVTQFKKDEAGKERALKAHRKKEPALTIERSLYRRDGSVVNADEPLAKGETYVLLIRGSGKADPALRGSPLLVVNPGTSGLKLMAVGNADAKAISALWPWLPSHPTEVDGYAESPTASSFALSSTNEWRIVCLLKAELSGTFTLPPVRVRDLSGKSQNLTQSALRWQVF